MAKLMPNLFVPSYSLSLQVILLYDKSIFSRKSPKFADDNIIIDHQKKSS